MDNTENTTGYEALDPTVLLELGYKLTAESQIIRDDAIAALYSRVTSSTIERIDGHLTTIMAAARKYHEALSECRKGIKC